MLKKVKDISLGCMVTVLPTMIGACSDGARIEKRKNTSGFDRDRDTCMYAPDADININIERKLQFHEEK